ncbi:unnamed protein product [Closterium sp. NIES-65]|nr:unnamed protein product [Closterium sp. NIES-65]
MLCRRGSCRVPPSFQLLNHRHKRSHGSYSVAPRQPRSPFARALSFHLLLIGALLFSPSLPVSRTHDAAAPLLALAQGREASFQLISSLFVSWSEAYGLGGNSTTPPAKISLPPRVPAAPHLEDCARVSAEREAWERRGGRGEEPAWARGAPGKVKGDSSAASAGCSAGQAQGEEVAQPPWIRGQDAANLPLTRVVQRDIWRNQFPAGDCTNRRLLVADWAKSAKHGVGSQIHYMSAMLSLAMRTNRTLVDEPDTFDRANTPACEAVGHKNQWECFFFPMVSPACQKAYQQALQKGPDKIPRGGNDFSEVAGRNDTIVFISYPNPTRLSMESGAAALWNEAVYKTPCTVQIDGKLTNRTERLRKVHWWRAQAVRFLLRWPSAHLCHVSNRERHRAFGMIAANHVAQFLQTQSKALSFLSRSTATASADATGNGKVIAPVWEARVREVLEKSAAANSPMFFQLDPSGAAAAGAATGSNGDKSKDGDSPVGVHEPYMPRPIVSLHVRGTDKYSEMGLSSLASHIFHMNRLRPHAPDLWHVWLNTETQANIDRAAEHTSWTFFYSSNARQQDKAGSLRQYEHDQSVALSLASVLIAAHVRRIAVALVVWLSVTCVVIRAHTHASETGPGIPNPFDFAFPDHLCGSLRETYMTINDRVRAACKVEAQAAVAAGTAASAGSSAAAAAAPPAAAPPSASPATPGTSPASASSAPSQCRTLIFDSGHDGFGDTVFGLASTFAVALLDDRAFLMRQEWLPFAFEPATFDWRVTEDIPLTTYSPQIMDPDKPPNASYARLSLYNKNVDPEEYFGKLKGISHIGLVWNRGILFNLLTKAKGAWAERFKAIGMTPPYAFACVMRFLLRPKPEVWQLMRDIAGQVHVPHGISIGIHTRVKDLKVWEHSTKDGVPKVLNAVEVEELYVQNKLSFECAQELERWWSPSSLKIKWFFICNSAQLKVAVHDKFPDKVVITDFVPRHVAISKDPNSTSHTAAPSWYQETVAEWLLLASSDLLVIPESGFSRSAVMYSMRPGRVFMPQKCRPDAPVPVGDLATVGCGV